LIIKGLKPVSGEFIDTEHFYKDFPAGKITEIDGVKIKGKCAMCKQYIPQNEDTHGHDNFCNKCLNTKYVDIFSL